jgi:ABC-type uncharacterized transport system substrate-binding protein
VGALQQATRTVPIVFATVADPVGAGFVDSLSRPGGNITGFATSLTRRDASTQCRRLRPAVRRVAPKMPFSDSEMAVGVVCCRAGGGGRRGQIAPVDSPESPRAKLGGWA